MIGKVADLISYAAARGVAIGEDEASMLLTKAGDYLAIKCWYGVAAGDDDPWPRTGLVYDGSALLDANGDVITTIEVDGEQVPIEKGDIVTKPATPKSIVTATYRLAIEVSSGVALMPTISGSAVLSERVEGAVAVTYAESTIGTPLNLPWLHSLIGAWIACEEASGVNFTVNRG